MKKGNISKYIRNIADSFPNSEVLSDNEVLLNTDSISLYIELLNTDSNNLIMNIETSIGPLNLEGIMILQDYTNKDEFMDENGIQTKRFLNQYANLCIQYVVNRGFVEEGLKRISSIIPVELDSVEFTDSILRSLDFQDAMESSRIWENDVRYDTYDDYGINTTAVLHKTSDCFCKLDYITWLEQQLYNEE